MPATARDCVHAEAPPRRSSDIDLRFPNERHLPRSDNKRVAYLAGPQRGTSKALATRPPSRSHAADTASAGCGDEAPFSRLTGRSWPLPRIRSSPAGNDARMSDRELVPYSTPSRPRRSPPSRLKTTEHLTSKLCGQEPPRDLWRYPRRTVHPARRPERRPGDRGANGALSLTDRGGSSAEAGRYRWASGRRFSFSVEWFALDCQTAGSSIAGLASWVLAAGPPPTKPFPKPLGRATL